MVDGMDVERALAITRQIADGGGAAVKAKYG
jgi:hypothetical protein